jgi:chromatin remodeling complex protein RSC6
VAPELLVLLKVPAGGVEVLTRPTIVQYIWKYIKAQGLQNLRDKRKIEFGVDNPLGRILGVQRTTMFGLQKVISEHIASCNSSGVSEAESKTIEGEKSS